MIPRLAIADRREARPVPPPVAEGDDRTRGNRLHAFLLFFLIALVCWQSCVVHTHFHGKAPLSAAPASADALIQGAAIERHGLEPGDDCPICREEVAAGSYLQPAPITLVRATTIVAWYYLAGNLLSIDSPRSHGWRSRAPPEGFRLI